MRAKDVVGRWGEDTAVRHLEASGLQILGRNWRCPDGEIDIVAREDDCLVVCEVKTRSGTAFGTPAEAVGPRKAARLRRLAMCWLDHHRSDHSGVRFDVVSVLRLRTGGTARVEHIRGAF